MTNPRNIAKSNSVDLLKFLMSILVVAIHTDPLIDCTSQAVLTLYNMIAQMAVPFFFLSSGYLLATKFDPACHTTANIFVIAKHLRKILRMYVLWSIVYFPLAVFYYCANDISVLKAIYSYIKNLIFVGEHCNSWHLWYLLSTIYALLALLSLLHLKVKPGFMLLFSVIISLVSICMDELVQYPGTLPAILGILKKVIAHTTVNGRILRGLVYMPIGMIMTKKEFSSKTYLSVFSLCFVSNFFIANSFISSCLLIVTSIALFGIILHVNLKNHALYPLLRSLSTDIYLLHMYVWTIYYFITYGEKTSGLDSFLVTTAVSVVLGLIHVFCKRHVSQKQ